MSIANQQSKKDNPLLRVPKEHRMDWRAFMQVQMSLPESDTRWQGMCESLQRQAHGFQARFASAYAHMIATPKSERIDPREAPVGAFIFVDDLNDSNAYGHIVGKWMHNNDLNAIPVVTNDVTDSESGYDPGNITVVPLGWFPRYWGDSVQYATLWFGPDRVPTEPMPRPPSPQEDTEEWVKSAISAAREVIEMMKKARRDNDEDKFPRHERAITREIKDQQEIIASLQQLLP